MVYFIQEKDNPEGLIKIGKTTDIGRRLQTLQVGCPVPLVVLSIIAEAASDLPYHEKFWAYKKRGEWFIPHPRLLDFISSLGPLSTPNLPKKRKGLRGDCRCGGVKQAWQRVCKDCFYKEKENADALCKCGRVKGIWEKACKSCYAL